MQDLHSQEARPPGILLVDDDSLLLTVLSLGFRKRGFKVWIAAHGLVARELYEQHQSQIDAVLLDVSMPFFDGPDTLEMLRQINPDVQCWFITGGSSKYTEEDLQARAAGVFYKPFRLEEVVAAMSLAARL